MPRAYMATVLSSNTWPLSGCCSTGSVCRLLGDMSGLKLHQMKPYRPNVELEKRRYWLRESLKRIRGEKPFDPNPIKSNSEPWIQFPRTLADAEKISDNVEAAANQWRQK